MMICLELDRVSARFQQRMMFRLLRMGDFAVFWSQLKQFTLMKHVA